MKTPLAWLQLTHERLRLVVALAGIGFADLLMFMQLGFRNSLFDSAVAIHKHFQGDLVLISPRSNSLTTMISFDRSRLYQAKSIDGVESASPFYITAGEWKNPKTNVNRTIFVFGFDPEKPVFNLPEINQQINQIKLKDVYLFDRGSRPEFGPVVKEFEQGQEVSTELSDRRVKVGGLFYLGASFALDGNLVTSDLNFLRLTNRSLNKVDVAFIKVKSGADPQVVLNRLKEKWPDKEYIQQTCSEADNLKKACPKEADVRAMTMQQFMEFERKYWDDSTPIGFIFGLGVTMGFIVGIVIVYQILYTDVANHLAEYATLKAMGYTDLYLLSVIFQEALILSVLGYIPGFIISFGLYSLAQGATGIPMGMTIDVAVTVFILTVIMCFASGAIAVRKLQAADPADIF